MAGADVVLQRHRAGPSSARTSPPALTKGSRTIVTGRLEQRSWETQEGEKRSVVEVVADEVGPSLRWAQAQIERNERSSSEGSFAGGGGAAAAAAAAAPVRAAVAAPANPIPCTATKSRSDPLIALTRS